MPDYKQIYFELFKKISDIIEELQIIQNKMEEKNITNSDKDEKE